MDDIGKIQAVSNLPTQREVDDMLKFFGLDPDITVDCPECDLKVQIKYMIIHLNDKGTTWSSIYEMNQKPEDPIPRQTKSFKNHMWTFKQIGKWLESIGY